MKQIKFNLSLVILLSIIVLFSSSNSLANDDSLALRYEELSHQVYNLEAEVTQLKNDLVELKTEAEELTNLATSYYWQGQIYFLKAELNTDNKVDYLEQSQELLEESIAENNQYSDSYRALADVYMRLLDNKGTIFAIRNGPKVLDLLEMAMALDDNNRAVYNAKGKAYFEAPSVGGGSDDKALEFLNQALEIEAENEQLDQFFSYYYLAEIHLELENYEQALDYVEQALNIFPNNQESQNLRDEIMNNIS